MYVTVAGKKILVRPDKHPRGAAEFLREIVMERCLLRESRHNRVSFKNLTVHELPLTDSQGFRSWRLSHSEIEPIFYLDFVLII